MPGKAKPSVLKRNREQALREHHEKKAARRKARALERGSRRDSVPPGEDPDIAHIVPGPQHAPAE